MPFFDTEIAELTTHSAPFRVSAVSAALRAYAGMNNLNGSLRWRVLGCRGVKPPLKDEKDSIGLWRRNVLPALSLLTVLNRYINVRHGTVGQSRSA